MWRQATPWEVSDQPATAGFNRRCACSGEVEGSSGALECELHLMGALQRLPPELPFATLWSCPVLFTDEPARAAQLQGLAAQQRRLGAQQAELQGRLDEKSAVCVCAATCFCPTMLL